VDKVWTQAFRSTDVDHAVVERQFERITDRVLDELRQEGFTAEPEIQKAINMRYLGQNYEHEVDLPARPVDDQTLRDAFARFDQIHRDRYGYAIDGETIELVSFKVTAVGRRPQVELASATANGLHRRSTREVFFRGVGATVAQVVHRDELLPGEHLQGPVLVQEEGSTTLVAPGMAVEQSPHGSLVITIEGNS
jgi:N-methylhydantoinase A